MTRIAVIPGDGIGREVTAIGREILALYRDKGLPLDLWELDLGADRYLRDGVTMPREVFQEIRNTCGAVLLGALGDPRVPGNEHARDILFGLRLGLDLYANVRPCRPLDDRLVPLKGRSAAAVDFVVFRENTEGIYVGIGGNFRQGTPDEVAINEDLNTRRGVERIIRAAFEHAVAHGRKTVHMADKSNAMRQAGGLWQRTFADVSRAYPRVTPKHVYVDALCLYLGQDPGRFEVIVTNNLFGDIVTDLAAGLQGGLGMAASASLHAQDPKRIGLFEPVHGSAPDIAGKDLANPLATVLTVGMLLSHLGHPQEEQRLERLVQRAIREEKCTRDVGGALGCRAVGDYVLGLLRAEL